MLKNIIKGFAITVICLFTLSIFGWISVHLSKGDKKFGILNEPVKFMYSFPDMFNESVEEAKTFALPKTFVKTPNDFQPINKLESNLFALTAYSDTNNSRTVAIINLKNNEIDHKWVFTQKVEDHTRIFHPLLLPNKELIYSIDGHRLARVDSVSNIIWEQKKIWPHHSKNVDSNGDI